ncbi:LAAT1 protein, partial [Turnix velox]|nr:LAAT1 protein [Turnix velox]
FAGSLSLRSFCVAWVTLCSALAVVLPCQLLLKTQDQRREIERSKGSLDVTEMSGFICGYISSVFYLGSRFPQLYKNFRRRSTEGTSYLLFALAMMGNCTYGMSLILKMPPNRSFQTLYFLHHLPWLIGSFGVLFLDFFVSFILLYLEFLKMGLLTRRSDIVVCLE